LIQVTFMDACKWIARARRSNRNNTHGTPQKGLKDVTRPQQDRMPTTKKVSRQSNGNSCTTCPYTNQTDSHCNNRGRGHPQKGLKDVTQPQQDRIPTTKKVCIPTTKSAQAVKWQQLHHMPQHKSNGHECDLNQFDLHKRGTLSAITK